HLLRSPLMGPECRGEASSDFHSGIDHDLTIRVRKVVFTRQPPVSSNGWASEAALVSCVGDCGALMVRGDFTRWLYRGQQPNRLARILNRALAIAGSLGVAPNYLVTLEVRGHKSGRVISFPLVMAVVDGQRYLVSMLGEKVAWVTNVRAAGGKAVLRHGRREEIRLEEVPAGQRAPILKAYLRRAP